MGRILLVVLLLLLSFAESADAQAFGRNRFRRRYPSTPTAQNPVVTIQTPTGQPTHQTPDPSIILTGTVSDGDGVAVSVSVTNTTTAQTVPCVLTTEMTWSCGAGGGGGAQVVFSDTFNTASNTVLELHDPNIGPASDWTEIFDSPGPRSIYAHTVGVARANTSGTGYGVIYRADPDPALVGSNYDVSFKNAVAFSTNATSSIIFRITDGSNYCFLKVYGSGRSPDLELGTWTSGTTSTPLGSANANPGSTSTILLEVRGTSLTVKVDGVTAITATSSYCDDTPIVGLGMGNVNGVATDQLDTQYIDDFTITDQDTTNTLDLSLGTNTLVVTAIDDDGNMGSRQVVVTRGVDTQAPLISITSPNGGLDYATSMASLVVAVDTSDNVETTSVQVKLGAGSFSACTLSGSGLVKTAVCPAVTLSVGMNTVTVRATDAAANFAEDTLNATYSLLDITAPTVTITTNGGSNFTSPDQVIVLAGTASDNVGVTQVDYSCTTCSPTVGFVTNQPTNWQFLAIALGNGVNNITVSARDQAANGPGTATISVTYSPSLSISTLSPLSTVTEDVVMQTKVIQATGGTLPYTWTIDGTPKTVNDSDPQCAGAVWADVGNELHITGTPTTVGVCTTGNIRVTDSVSATTFAVLTFTVAAAGSGPHAYFESLIQRADFNKGLSFRPTGVTCTTTHSGVSFASGVKANGTCNPYFTGQLLSGGTGYSNGTTTSTVSPNMTYNYVGDTHPQKQDAGKLQMASYELSPGCFLLADAITDTQTQFVVDRPCANGITSLSNAFGFRIDDELMTCDSASGDVNPVAAGNQCYYSSTDVGGQYIYTFNVLRGTHGSTKASHAAGADLRTILPGATSSQQVRFPTLATEGSTYIFTWDYYVDNNWLNLTEGANQKTWQFAGGDTPSQSFIMFEHKHSQAGQTSASPCSPAYNRATYAHTDRFRVYNGAAPPPGTLWTETNGNTIGPGMTALNESIQPQAATFCHKAGQWNRVWWRIQARVDDWDIVDMWTADEQTDPVQVWSNAAVSIKNSNGGIRQIVSWYSEFNDTAYVHQWGNGPDRLRDMTVYIRNFALLKSADGGVASAGSLTDAAFAALRVKPLPDN